MANYRNSTTYRQTQLRATNRAHTHTHTHTHVTNGRELKSPFSIPHNTKLTLNTDCVTICLFKTPKSPQTDTLN